MLDNATSTVEAEKKYMAIHSDLEPQTQASALFERIRRDIVEAVLPPGSKLKVRELAERLQSGGSPVREALSRLLSSSLVVAEDHRGFRVAPVTLEEFERLTWARVGVESLALGSSLQRGDRHWESELVAAHHLLTRVARPTNLDSDEYRQWDFAHKNFHRALLAACDAPWLLDFVDSLYDQAARYRWLVMRQSPRQFERLKANEHTALLDAALARDIPLATRLVEAHYQKTMKLCREVLEKDADR